MLLCTLNLSGWFRGHHGLTGRTAQELEAYAADEKKMVSQMDSSNTAQAQHIQANFLPKPATKSAHASGKEKMQHHMVGFFFL